MGREADRVRQLGPALKPASLPLRPATNYLIRLLPTGAGSPKLI